jgi:hypothetical protein
MFTFLVSRRATKVVKPLERVLLDNGISLESVASRNWRTSEPLEQNGEHSGEQDGAMSEEDDTTRKVNGSKSLPTKSRSSTNLQDINKLNGSLSSARNSLSGSGASDGTPAPPVPSRSIASFLGCKEEQQQSSLKGQTQYTKAVNYHTIAANPSMFPIRQCFCSVCGFIGNYSCTRCGSKFCSIKCNENHKETRCFKFSL